MLHDFCHALLMFTIFTRTLKAASCSNENTLRINFYIAIKMQTNDKLS